MVITVFTISIWKRFVLNLFFRTTCETTTHTAVLVLGDVGRSPRMQYHAWSIAQLNTTSDSVDTKSGPLSGIISRSVLKVALIGHAGEDCIDKVQNNPHISLHRFAPLQRPIAGLPFILWAPVKVVAQIMRLFYVLLFEIPKPAVLLVQTPPAIPTLFVAIIASAIMGTRLIVDWHNFGYTILQINLNSSSHPFVRLAYWYERLLSRYSSGNFCVTNAMQRWLMEEWDVKAHVLHDQPPDFFHRTTVKDAHDLFQKFEADPKCKLHKALLGDAWNSKNNSKDSTLLTNVNEKGEVEFRHDRPALVVSSTSWTKDEDFGILLEAVVQLDRRLELEKSSQTNFPHIVFIVTGKGPQKAMYEAQIAKLSMIRCHIVTAWLEAVDYPRLMGCCDLGISLHYSSSGLDLPMKILDMFGAGMPVCAVHFACLHELVQHNVNGLIFNHGKGSESGIQLANQLYNLFAGFSRHETTMLTRLREGVKPGSWTENWNTRAKPLLFG
jgi:beta-1,4-mannosyltransferase